jgi:hypothetical protein
MFDLRGKKASSTFGTSSSASAEIASIPPKSMGCVIRAVDSELLVAFTLPKGADLQL